ncbi:MAG: biopolymer transporter ExbD [Bacteroidetes bacterium]|nr:MAG: biopolymer transporter ExbD [Bacteroidota bacterium]
MARQKLGGFNASSMADIAFLLLIFFLVTTTMDTDSGISRKLPPMPEKNQQKSSDRIKERNVFVVLINKNNQLLVEGEPMDVSQLKDKAKEFIENPANNPKLPEKKITEIDNKYFGSQYPVSKGVISLQNDRGTSYGTYIKVQDELASAYNELRDELSMRTFSKKYGDLSDSKKDLIKKIYPQRISEAEPKNVGGGK